MICIKDDTLCKGTGAVCHDRGTASGTDGGRGSGVPQRTQRQILHHRENASVADYRRATGFEALMGYLYLTGQIDRMLQLIKDGIRLAGMEL